MRTLIVGIGALGGLIAARLRAAGSPVWLATRNAESAARLKASGLRVTGVGGAVSVETVEVAPLDEYLTGSRFDLIVLATKAHDAIEVASKLSGLLEPGGTPVSYTHLDVYKRQSICRPRTGRDGPRTHGRKVRGHTRRLQPGPQAPGLFVHSG